MRVMVTGATTAFGVALVRALLADRDVEYVIAVASDREGIPNGPRIEYRSLDLQRPRVIHDLVWGEAHARGITAVVHAMQHRHASDRGRRVHAQNVETAHALLLAATDHPSIRRFVYRSFGEVYALGQTTSNLLDEESPLDFDPSAPQWVRDRVEADLLVSSHFAGPLSVAVLRCADICAPDTGSQLWDYLQSRVCLRPFGFDPMINVLSLDDAVAAHLAALRSSAVGVFNIPGLDTLPLSRAIIESRRADIPVPGPVMAPLYRLRRMVAGFDFRYDTNLRRFHFGGVLDGSRARARLGYVPRTAVHWPRPQWQELLERLSAA